MLRPVRTLLLLAATCLVTVTAVAGPAEIIAPPAGTVLHPGEVVEVRWTAPPADSDELELLLSLDGSWRAPVRLTECLATGPQVYRWRVPALASGTARLRVRYGGPRGEILAEPGPALAITPSFLPPAGVVYRAGEWWVAPQPGVWRAPGTVAARAPAAAPVEVLGPAGTDPTAAIATARRAARGPADSDGDRRGVPPGPREHAPRVFPLRP